MCLRSISINRAVSEIDLPSSKARITFARITKQAMTLFFLANLLSSSLSSWVNTMTGCCFQLKFKHLIPHSAAHHNDKLRRWVGFYQALWRRRARAASAVAPIAAKAQVDGSGTALIVIRPPVMVGVGPVVPEGVLLFVYSLLPSVI